MRIFQFFFGWFPSPRPQRKRKLRARPAAGRVTEYRTLAVETCEARCMLTVPIISISAPDNMASETGDTAKYTFSRVGSTSGDIVVQIHMSGQGTNGTDYVTIGGTFTMPSGASSADLYLTPKADTIQETGGEGVTLMLPDVKCWPGLGDKGME